ncbi:hypothetical protein LLEC1_06369 [Akanthomyces lecanii]|uniref:Uncharacterized protein n=1 Tax=Cordyceps confragosa TaxID=2714763 RepID=A0A179IAZ5_CORDF|nr:hypothetical protein LLEC1_06369 [Akanthomyces lecanii]
MLLAVALRPSPPISDSYIAARPRHAARGAAWQPFSLPMPASGYDPASVPVEGLKIIHLPLRQQTASPTSTAEYSPASPSRTSSSACSSRSSLSRRRSVSSMKGLMPLTLSASASSYTTPILPGDSMEQRVDDYLPELLARDLELASDVFTSKSMTAGAPSYSIVADYMARARAAGQFTDRLSMASPFQPASSRVQILGAIEEKDSMASFLEQREQQHQHRHSYPDTSDMDSISSEDETSGMPPPPFRYRRNTSIVTAATSVEGSVRKSSPQPPSPHAEPVHCSWIDGDSGNELEVDEESDSDAAPEPVSPLLFPLSPRPPRPSTPPTVVDNDPFPLDYEQSAAVFRSRLIHKKSHSVTGVATFESSLRPSPLVLPATARRTSRQGLAAIFREQSPDHTNIPAQELQRATSQAPSPVEQRTPMSHSHILPSTPPPFPQKHHQRLSRISAESLQKQSPTVVAARQPVPVPESPPMSDAYISDAEAEESSLYNDGEGSWRGLRPDYSRATPPASPSRHLVTLANTAKPYVPNFGGDELARVVPLPPDVIETLRVSVACFPETILLSSSLTIDTIRSYSKKMRLPDTELMRLSSPLAQEDTGRKSIWQKVSALKRASSASLRQSAMQSANRSRSGSIAGVDSQKTWSAIQNVFGTCSEYICDALFAHLMAYNYVSALLARSAAASAPPSDVARNMSHRRNAGRNSADRQQDDIPKKAASLLGLGDTTIEPSIAGGRHSRLARRTSTMTSTTSRPWSRDELLPGNPISSAGNDAPVRTVQEGLYKCIVRLIATARLMSTSGRLDEPISDADVTDADGLFMRSLCEIVRLVEETS